MFLVPLYTVLVLARIESIFFLVTGMVLHFGFRMVIILITSQCYSCYREVLTLSQGLSCQQGGWGCVRSWEGTKPGQMTQACKTDVTLCSAIKMEELARGLPLQHQSAGGEQLGVHHLFCAFFSFYFLVFPLFCLLNCPYLNP